MKRNFKAFLKDTKGDGFVDVLIKILIAVGIGLAIFLVLNAAMPELFEGMMTNIETALGEAGFLGAGAGA